MRRLLVLVALMGAMVALPGVAHAANPPCTGTIPSGTTVSGSLQVPSGANCSLAGVTVTGDVIVNPNGAVLLRGTSIGGSLVGSNARALDSFGGNKVTGSVSFTGTTGTPATAPALVAGDACDWIDGIAIGGSLTIANSSASAPWCQGAPSSMASASITGNPAFVNVPSSDTVRSSLTVTSNTGGGRVMNNTVGGSFTCNNNPKFTSTGNSVGGVNQGASGSC